MEMSCIILGGFGFLGQNLCRYLVSHGEKVTVYGRKTEHAMSVQESMKRNNVQHEVIWGDFEKEKKWDKILENIKIVFHLISTTKPSNQNMKYEFNSNVEASISLIETCVIKKIKIVFFSSGGTVYGIPRYLPIDELHATNPISTYGISKLAIEKCLMYYGYTEKLNYIILRIANPYGKGQNLNTHQGLIGISLARALAGQSIEIWGDGNIVRDYIYIDDLLDAVGLLVKYTGPYRIFNIGSNKGFSINEVVSIIQKYVKPRVSICYKPGRIQDVPANILSHELLSDETGWIPKVSIDEGIKRLIYSWNSELNCFV